MTLNIQIWSKILSPNIFICWEKMYHVMLYTMTLTNYNQTLQNIINNQSNKIPKENNLMVRIDMNMKNIPKLTIWWFVFNYYHRIRTSYKIQNNVNVLVQWCNIAINIP